MSAPAVSIIVPVLNTRDYLEPCLDGIVHQSLANVEVICVDNGSDDGSYEVLQAYAKKDSRFVALRHAEGRQGAARNAALDRAKGRYIGFVDSDDLIHSRMFQRMYEVAGSTGAPVAVCNMGVFSDCPSRATPSLPGELLKSEGPVLICDRPKLLRNLTICNKLFSRSFIEDTGLRFPEGLWHEDQLFVIKALLLSRRIAVSSDLLYFYRKGRTGSVSSHRGNNNLDIFRVMQQVSEFAAYRGMNGRDRDLIEELKVSRILNLSCASDGGARRNYYSMMRDTFRQIDLPAGPRLLTRTELREYRVVRASRYPLYRCFLLLRTAYGTLTTNRWARGSSRAAGDGRTGDASE